jgi:hypothetical protein
MDGALTVIDIKIGTRITVILGEHDPGVFCERGGYPGTVQRVLCGESCRYSCVVNPAIGISSGAVEFDADATPLK